MFKKNLVKFKKNILDISSGNYDSTFLKVHKMNILNKEYNNIQNITTSLNNKMFEVVIKNIGEKIDILNNIVSFIGKNKDLKYAFYNIVKSIVISIDILENEIEDENLS